jgi:hypothetical protein
MLKFVQTVKSVTSTSTATLAQARFYFRTLVVTPITSTASLAKAFIKVLAVSTASAVSFAKLRLVLLVTSVYTTAVVYAHKLVFNVKDTLFVPTRKVALQLVSFTSILVRPKKTNVVASKQDDLDG